MSKPSQKYYVDGRGKSLQGPYTLDKAREKAATLANPKGKNVKGVRIFALHEQVRAPDEETMADKYHKFLPDKAQKP